MLCVLSCFSCVWLFVKLQTIAYSLPDSSVHRILQARILEWFAMLASRGSSWPRNWTHVSCVSPGDGNGNPFQYSCLENPVDRETWQAIVPGVAKSQTWLSNFQDMTEQLSLDHHKHHCKWEDWSAKRDCWLSGEYLLKAICLWAHIEMILPFLGTSSEFNQMCYIPNFLETWSLLESNLKDMAFWWDKMCSGNWLNHMRCLTG